MVNLRKISQINLSVQLHSFFCFKVRFDKATSLKPFSQGVSFSSLWARELVECTTLPMPSSLWVKKIVNRVSNVRRALSFHYATSSRKKRSQFECKIARISFSWCGSKNLWSHFKCWTKSSRRTCFLKR